MAHTLAAGIRRRVTGSSWHKGCLFAARFPIRRMHLVDDYGAVRAADAVKDLQHFSSTGG